MLYHGSDMYEMRRRKPPRPTLFPTQGIFNLPQLAFDDAVDYTQWGMDYKKQRKEHRNHQPNNIIYLRVWWKP